MDGMISAATQRNWKKLNTDAGERLTARANKKRSRKKFVPAEYFVNPQNMGFVQEIAGLVEAHGWETAQVLYTIGSVLLRQKGIAEKPHVQAVLQEYGFSELPMLAERPVPMDEWDLLGLIYQSTLYEGKKNIAGSYYTPKAIVSAMTGAFDFSAGQTFLDPCCGSGAFLLSMEQAAPEQLTGIDNDPVAVMIAKINLLLKYPDRSFVPEIVCLDYLQENDLFHPVPLVCRKKFDYIATNPPWGAASDSGCAVPGILSKESFALFYVKAYEQLKPGGSIRFLFPEAVLNVKCHKDLRAFMLEYGCMEQITAYGGAFTGVTTKYVDILCRKTASASFQAHPVTVVNEKETLVMDSSVFYQTKNKVIRWQRAEDLALLDHVKAYGRYDLSGSVWALGIVTGDNKKKLKTVCEDGWEAIYTGKEIAPYRLKPAKHYLRYDRSDLQQAARDEYYRASEKLVYKFISSRLVFAYDNTGSLFLNSANILIPDIPHMGIKTVMAYLNSELFQYLYTQMFGEVKILKGNLIQLPFPEITSEQNTEIEKLVDEILGGGAPPEALQTEIYKSYHLSDEQIAYVRSLLDIFS